MSNEIVDLKLNGSGEETTKSTQPEVLGPEYTEGSYRYDALKESDVNNLVSDSRPTLITLFGVIDSGKTTFVGSLFAILRRRPELLNVTFLDSDSLTGFERRVHQRLLSEYGISEQQRTPRRANSILNAIIGDERGNHPHMFVFSDQSGEIYREAITKDVTVKEQIAVRYADKLVYFVDIEALLDDKKYMLYKKQTSTLLTRFKTNTMLPIDADTYIVFNKIDLVEKTAEEVSKKEDGSLDEEIKQAFISTWEQRRSSVLEVIKGIVDVQNDHVFDICSKGIQRESEDEGLISLFKLLLEKPKKKSLSSEYNWIQGVL